MECFADEIAIDFPSVGRVVERMRDRFLGERAGDAAGDTVSTEVSLSPYEAWRGHVVPIDVPVRATCGRCGGRGETWAEPCLACGGTGEAQLYHAVNVPVPAGVTDGARLRFKVTGRYTTSVRVEIRVAIRPAAV